MANRVNATQLPRPALVVGIDPGAHSGMALYEPATAKLLRCWTATFWEAYDYIVSTHDTQTTLVILEDASLNKPTFRKSDDRRKQDRISRNVGNIQRESQLLAEGLERQGFRVYRERPTEGKWNRTTFRRATGYRGNVSQHAIDAAKLVYGVDSWIDKRQ